MEGLDTRRFDHDKLIELVRAGKFCSQTSAATWAGVSRERVRQVLKKRGVHLSASQPNTLISWPCPTCGEKVEMWTRKRRARKTAWCSKCRQREQGKAKRLADVVLTCSDCGKQYSWKGRSNMLSSKKRKATTLCTSCWGRKSIKLLRPPRRGLDGGA